MNDSDEFIQWESAWSNTIASEPQRVCLCGGTFARHKLFCPYAPPHGYDNNGKPFRHSQIVSAFAELGKASFEQVCNAILDKIGREPEPKRGDWNEMRKCLEASR